MKNETAIVQRTNNTEIASPRTMQEINELGKVFRASGFFPEIKNEAQAVVKIMAGQELGISPMQAMQNIFVISTKDGANIQISSHHIAASIKQSQKYNYKLKENTDQKCTIEFFENGESQGEYTYTIKDAQAAGLATRYIWKAHTKDMLFNRCISGGYKKFCPDVIGMPVYTEGEFAEVEIGNSELGMREEKKNATRSPEADEVKVVNAEDVLGNGNGNAKFGNGNSESGNRIPNSEIQTPKTSDRPYSVPTLLDKYELIANKYPDQADPDEVLTATKSLIAGSQNHGPKKETVMKFFVGEKKLDELSKGDCTFFQKWIGHKPGKAAGWYDPEFPEALEEFEAVYNATLNGDLGNGFQIDDDNLFGDEIS
jgi:hypothetical protein